MDKDAQVYSNHHGMQQRDTKILLEKFAPLMKWNDGKDILMDIGCGPGTTTLRMILPTIPEIESIIAVDVLPSMIKFAKAQSAHPKISYHTANIADETTLGEWQGKITKIISIYCFNWLQDHKTAFKNIYNLLCNDGEALLIFAISTPFWDGFSDLVNSPKWGPYIKDVNPHIPESNAKGYGSHYFREMLENIGFSVLACEEEKKTYSYENDFVARESGASRCAFTNYIPIQLKEAFKDDVFKMLIKYNGRDKEGKPELFYSTITLHLKKPL